MIENSQYSVIMVGRDARETPTSLKSAEKRKFERVVFAFRHPLTRGGGLKPTNVLQTTTSLEWASCKNDYKE